MPFNDPIALARIKEWQLVPHLRRQLKQNAGDTILQFNFTSVILAEHVDDGDAVAIDASGLGVRAGELPAIGISTAEGEAGDLVELQTQEYESERYDFNPGDIVWLTNSAVNVVTESPVVANGTLIQRLGIATSQSKFIVAIEPSARIQLYI